MYSLILTCILISGTFKCEGKKRFILEFNKLNIQKYKIISPCLMHPHTYTFPKRDRYKANKFYFANPMF